MTDLKSRRPIGNLTLRRLLLALVASAVVFALAAPARAQVVLNPTRIQFDSPDHNTTLPTGGYLIDHYVLEIWLQGVNPATGSPFQTVNLGRPDAVAGTNTITVNRSELFIGLPVGQTYFATVTASGPVGDSRSYPSSAFVTVLPPAPPEDVGVVPAEVVLYASDFLVSGSRWKAVDRGDAADGLALENPERGEPEQKPKPSPDSYVEAQFVASPGVAYHLWIRLQAEGDSHKNDSVFVQFSGALDATGAPIYAIGSNQAASVVLEESKRVGIRGWGWNDQETARLAAPIYFDSSGVQTVRIQQREDGVTFDQVVLSPVAYLTSSPGSFTDCTVIVPKQ